MQHRRLAVFEVGVVHLEHGWVAGGEVGSCQESIEFADRGADSLVVVDADRDGGVLFDDAAAVGDAGLVVFVH